MRIEITQSPSNNTYDWQMWDGPDGIDYFEGNELDLGQCFEQITVRRTLNALNYDEVDYRTLCKELADELDKYVSPYSPEGKVLYNAFRILDQCQKNQTI
jgi:hypothetical protein